LKRIAILAERSVVVRHWSLAPNHNVLLAIEAGDFMQIQKHFRIEERSWSKQLAANDERPTTHDGPLCGLLTWIVFPASAATCFSARWWTPEFRVHFSKQLLPL
jgi:hypothetical protein